MVSVCMATYNGEKFIKQQIASILMQLSESDELIISDDGSSDKTIEIIKSFGDKRIKLLNHTHNPSYEKIKHSRSFYYATDNFENALKEAKGEYIFLSDQDDVWAENKIQEIIPLLEKYDCVMCNNQVIDSSGNYVNYLPTKPHFVRSFLINLIVTPFLGCCMAFSKRAMNYILPFPKNLICFDLWIGCLCAYKRSMFFLDKPLHYYRYHENQVSPGVTRKSKNPFWFMIQYRIEFLIQFYKRILLK